jgi:hypothetical protein
LASVSRGNRAGESRGAPAGLFEVDIVIGILLAHGSNFCTAQFIAGGEARRYQLAVSTLPETLLFTAYRHSSSCSSRRRLPRHRCAFHSAPFAFFARMMVLQFIAVFFLMPESRGVALERMNEPSHVRAKVLAPQYVMPRTLFAVPDD